MPLSPHHFNPHKLTHERSLANIAPQLLTMFSNALRYLEGGRLTLTLWGSSFADCQLKSCQPPQTWTSPPESKIRHPPCFTVSSACLTVLGLSIPGRKIRIASLLALPSCLLRTLRLTPSIQPPPTCTFKLKTGGKCKNQEYRSATPFLAGCSIFVSAERSVPGFALSGVL